MNSPLHWVALNSICGLGPVRILRLLSRFHTAENILKQSTETLQTVGIASPATLSLFKNPHLLEHAYKQVKRAEELGIHILTLTDEEYPPQLLQISSPPPVLYVKGNIHLLKNQSIAIIGTRNPDHYGKNVVSTLVADLVKTYDLTIVSGMALGIDAMAHAACIAHQGKTIAVLGTGLECIYPKTNSALSDEICKTGALISEFPLSTPAMSKNFPQRNRIISGLSQGVCIIQAGKKSGSLITAEFALQQNREVFAVPGPIFSEKCEGTLWLLQQGAVPISSAHDIVAHLPVHTPPSRTILKRSSTKCCYATPDLSKEEQCLIDHIGSDPKRLDQLSEIMDITFNRLCVLLLDLELKGLIRQIPGQRYEVLCTNLATET